MPGLRILLILPEFPPTVGGMQTHAIEMSAALAARGYTIRVLAYQPVNRSDAAAYDAYDRTCEFPIVRCISRLGYFRNLKLVEDEGRDFRADLIYASTVFYGGAGEADGIPAVCRSPGNDVQRPWIAWPFRMMSGFVSRSWFENSIYQLFRRLDYPQVLERFYYRRRRELTSEAAGKAACILANSEFTAGHLRDVGVEKERVRVLPGGVDADRFQAIAPGRRADLRSGLGVPENAFLLLTVCRMVRKKGVDFVIECLAQLKDEYPELYFLAIGDGPKLKRWRRLASRLGVGDRVRLFGVIPQEKVHEWYGAADAFVLASRLVADEVSGFCDAETMGRALCEANAAGLPVLASNSGGIPSIVRHRDNGLLFEPDNYGSFADAFGDLHRDASLRESLVAGGLRRAREEFDWSVLVEAHERCFEEVLDSSRHV